MFAATVQRSTVPEGRLWPRQIPTAHPVKREIWMRLFEKHWEKQQGPYGYVLKDNEDFVGDPSLKTQVKDAVPRQSFMMAL